MQRTITLPNDRTVTLGTYVKAWRQLKRLPPQETVHGFSWYLQTAGQILREMRRGVHDRINRHLPHPQGRDSIHDLRRDRCLIEDALNHRSFRRRYPHLNTRHIDT